MRVTTHQTNLYTTDYTPYSTDNAVQMLLDAGVPAKKILIGGVLYSRGASNTDGLGKAYSGGSKDTNWEAGICDYKSLPREGATEYYDDKAGAGYSYDPIKRIYNSYDTVRSMTEKAQYIKRRQLGGIILWESSGDYPLDHPRSLLRVLKKELLDSAPSTPIKVPPSTPVPTTPTKKPAQTTPTTSVPTTPTKTKPSIFTFPKPTVKLVSGWSNGCTVRLEVTNKSDKPLERFKFVANQTLKISWAGNADLVNGKELHPKSWNNTIAPGSTWSLEFGLASIFPGNVSFVMRDS